jgi:hypothetical protein
LSPSWTKFFSGYLSIKHVCFVCIELIFWRVFTQTNFVLSSPKPLFCARCLTHLTNSVLKPSYDFIN